MQSLKPTTPQNTLRIALSQAKANYPVYDEILSAVTDSLEQAGASVRPIIRIRDANPQLDDLVLIIGGTQFHAHAFEDLAALRRNYGATLSVFFWHLEHLPENDTRWPKFLAYLLKAQLDRFKNGGEYTNSRGGNYLSIRQGLRQGYFNRVLTFTQRKAEFLNQHGLAAQYLPTGHHPIWGVDLKQPRDIDVFFLGEVLDDRRSTIVKQVRAELGAARVKLETMYDIAPAGLWGQQRNEVLNRTKIFLSVYRFAADANGLRLSLGMGNGALVVSEPVFNPHPFVAGKHFVETPVESLTNTILAYLKDDAARNRITSAASGLLSTEFNMFESAKQIVALGIAGRYVANTLS